MAFILVAEDYDEIRVVYRQHLEDAGHRVSTACNGAEALEKALQFPPDLILMDIDMPELDGMEALRMLKSDSRFASLRHIPVVLLTCHAMPKQVQAGLDAGCDAYIVKPVDSREIVAELDLFLNSGEVMRP
ncbi:MAG: response regulator [Bradymonadaceae bacterium]